MAVDQHKNVKGKSVKPSKRKKAKKKADGFIKKQLFLVAGLLMAIVFLPTTFLLSIALLPTLVAAVVDRTRRKTKAVTVGAMNLAGVSPFMLELWMEGNNFEKAFDVVTDPKAIIVVYSAAAVGYLIDWSMTGIVSKVLLQRGKARTKAIKKRQKELVERWGREVTGEVAMDERGFSIEEKNS